MRFLTAAALALFVCGFYSGGDAGSVTFGQELRDDDAVTASRLRRRLRSRRLATHSEMQQAPRLEYTPFDPDSESDYVVILDDDGPEVVEAERLPSFDGEPFYGESLGSNSMMGDTMMGGPMTGDYFLPDEYCEYCIEDCCTRRCRRRRFGVFAQGLYLQPGDSANVAFAVPVDGCGTNALPAGPVGVVDPDFDTGFRLGAVWLLKKKSALVGTYTWFETDETAVVTATPPNVIASLVTHPGTLNCAANSLETTARYDLRFQMIDLDYRHEICGGCYSGVDYLLGVRFGELEQRLQVDQTIGFGVTSVGTTIDFEGIGLRTGLVGETHPFCGSFLVYGRGVLNVLVGEFEASYLQFNSFAQTQATTSWQDDRLVPVLEWELGVGFSRAVMGRQVRLTAGYNLTTWFNSVTTGEYIGAVQAFDYRDIGDTLTFSGLVGRAEVIF